MRFAAIESGLIRAESFGQVTRSGGTPQEDWRSAAGTLYDPRIFGPSADFSCECGVTRGDGGQVCADCGVRIGVAAALRATRFGHVELAAAIRHPLDASAQITALPVLPIDLRTGPRWGDDLTQLYDAGLDANQRAARAASALPELERAVRHLLVGDAPDARAALGGRRACAVAYYLTYDPLLRREQTGAWLFALAISLKL